MDSWDLYRTDFYSCPNSYIGGFAIPMDFNPPNNNNNKNIPTNWTLDMMRGGFWFCAGYCVVHMTSYVMVALVVLSLEREPLLPTLERKIERAFTFHDTCTSRNSYLAPVFRLCFPPCTIQYLPTLGAPHTPSLAYFLIHVMQHDCQPSLHGIL
jgi:hypothetical protein